jgi:hypothetical protein
MPESRNVSARLRVPVMPLADGSRPATRCSAASCFALAISSEGRSAEAGELPLEVAAVFALFAALVALVAAPASDCDFATVELSLLPAALVATFACADDADAASPVAELASAHAEISNAAAINVVHATARVHHDSAGDTRAMRRVGIA